MKITYMKIEIKLPTASYSVTMDGYGLAALLNYIGKDKDGNPREGTTNLGFYGPGQVDVAIKRIIAEELNRNESVVNLREFLIRYKAIHESIAGQVDGIKEQIKKSREK